MILFQFIWCDDGSACTLWREQNNTKAFLVHGAGLRKRNRKAERRKQQPQHTAGQDPEVRIVQGRTKRYIKMQRKSSVMQRN